MRELFFAAAALALSATPTLAQGPCAPLPQALAALQKEAAEVPVARGLDQRGISVVLTLAPDGSFSVLAVRPDGVACLAFTGAGWEQKTPKPPGKDA